ncbi:MAG TPA: dihydrofolate reductase family protein [Solirubrobacteraceae bacterium]|nr:dihydrofolate reductase family protein [Solirubrobacteraceae bacterium]
MGKLVVTEFITVDGVFEDPGGAEQFEHGGWAFKFDRGPDGDLFKLEELRAADAHLLGRRTYEGFARAWPKMGGNEFGDKMNSFPKHVVTSSPLEPQWENSHVLEGELADGVSALKDRYDGDVLVAGSGTLVRALSALGLVDEYRLMVFPVLLGSGRRLFGETGAPRALRLLEARPAGACQILTYASAASD